MRFRSKSKEPQMKATYALFACCALLLGVNIALVRQNRSLKAQLSSPSPNLEATVGASVPDLKGYDVSGKPLTVAYGQDARKVLLLVFSPTCGFCKENWPKWEAMLAALDQAAVRPVGVDVTATSTPAFLSDHRFTSIPVLVQVDPAARLSYRLQLTPQTILIDHAGKIEKVWSGVLSDDASAEIMRLAGADKPPVRNTGQ
jgi:peroxiredoxin